MPARLATTGGGRLASTVKELDVAGRSLPSVAPRVNWPVEAIETSLKVATPFTAMTVVVPPNAPVPLRASVTAELSPAIT